MNTLLSFHGPHGINKTRTFFSILLLSFFFFSSYNSKAQGPGSLFVDAGPDITEECGSGKGCVDITATFLETFETASLNYTVSSIDYNPPFPFDGLANSLNR